MFGVCYWHKHILIFITMFSLVLALAVGLNPYNIPTELLLFIPYQILSSCVFSAGINDDFYDLHTEEGFAGAG